jgi:predicted DNA-binding protein (MmcQ/YjbR family)
MVTAQSMTVLIGRGRRESDLSRILNEVNDATRLTWIPRHGSVLPRSVWVMPAREDQLLAFALSLPEAWEDHPWGETVAKVRTKVFVFLGGKRITVKLVESHAHALSIDGAVRTGYGLGRAGWVTVPIGSAPLAVMRDWIEESYRIVAPKRLAASLDA